MEVTAFFTNNNVPLTSPGTLPTIRIRRIDTQALVVTDASMTEIGDGNYSFTFTPLEGVEYTVRADGDPLDNGQVKRGERFVAGSLNGDDEDLGEKVRDIWQNEGLDPVNSKVITEITEGADYDEDVGTIHKDVTRVGAVTTIDRT